MNRDSFLLPVKIASKRFEILSVYLSMCKLGVDEILVVKSVCVDLQELWLRQFMVIAKLLVFGLVCICYLRLSWK